MVFSLLAFNPPVGVNDVLMLILNDRLLSVACVLELNLRVSFALPDFIIFLLVLQTIMELFELRVMR